MLSEIIADDSRPRPRAQGSTSESTGGVTPETSMRVTKRNGQRETVDVTKIVRAVSRCCVGGSRTSSRLW